MLAATRLDMRVARIHHDPYGRFLGPLCRSPRSTRGPSDDLQSHSGPRKAATAVDVHICETLDVICAISGKQIGATENARHEFAAPVCTGGKCGKS